MKKQTKAKCIHKWGIKKIEFYDKFYTTYYCTKCLIPKEVVIEEAINKISAVQRKKEIAFDKDFNFSTLLERVEKLEGRVDKMWIDTMIDKTPDYSKKARQTYIKKMQNKEPHFLRPLLYIVGSLMIIGMLVQIFM